MDRFIEPGKGRIFGQCRVGWIVSLRVCMQVTG